MDDGARGAMRIILLGVLLEGGADSKERESG